ncbi:MAG: ComF family protein [Clostridium sp.]
MGKWICRRLRYVLSALIEIIYGNERVCYICDGHIEETLPVCISCREYLPYLEDGVLVYDNVNLEKVYSIFEFQGKIKEMVYDLKYNGLSDISNIIGDIMANYIQSNNIKVDVIIPIPMHESKIKKRGYNHIDLIAKRIGMNMGIKVDNSLKKINNTSPQVLLSGSERWYNVKGSFRADLSYRGKHILLIDDIVTTCATAHFARIELGDNVVSLLTFASTKKF